MATKKNTTTKKSPKAPVPKKPVKTTKKSTVKSTPAKPLHEEIAEMTPRKTERKPTSFRFKKSHAIILLGALLLIALLFALRSMLIAATVNGQPISRITVIKELERQSGKQTIDTMITKQLIMQEAKKKNITVTEEQVDQEIKKIEGNLKQQGQNLDQVLALQGLSRESLRDQVRIQKTVELLLGSQATVSEKEIDDYIASNSAQLPQDTDPKQLRATIQQELRQQKLSEKFQAWLAELRKNAQIEYIVNY